LEASPHFIVMVRVGHVDSESERTSYPNYFYLFLVLFSFGYLVSYWL